MISNHTQATRTRGFTLMEVLVVLLIMGLFVGLVSAVVRPDDRALLRVEAERLAQLMDLAAEQSRLTGDSIAWTADASGYRFWRLTRAADWFELHDNDLFRARTLPQGMQITGLAIENAPARGAMRLEFTPEAPPLAYTIELSLGAARYAVSASPVGELRVLPAEGDSSDGSAPR